MNTNETPRSTEHAPLTAAEFSVLRRGSGEAVERLIAAKIADAKAEVLEEAATDARRAPADTAKLAAWLRERARSYRSGMGGDES